jgi:predicted transposase YbfD/YdcC
MKPKLIATERPLLLTIAFDQLEDFRDSELILYPLTSILFIVLAGTIAGVKGWDALHEFASMKRKWFSSFIVLSKNVPSADTIRRVFESIPPDKFTDCFNHWIRMISIDVQGDVLCIDGKAVNSMYEHRGGNPLLYQLHVWSDKQKLIVGHKRIAGAAGEPKAARELLELIGIPGTTITGDANFCNRKMTKLIEYKKMKYVLALKKNREDIFYDIEKMFNSENESKPESHVEENKGHGRIEKRETFILTAGSEIKKKELWGEIKTVIKTKRTRTVGVKKEETICYHISNDIKPAMYFAKTIRGHWGIENKLHWGLDIILEEDTSRIRNKNSASNMSLVRRQALALLQKETSQKRSTIGKQRAAGWDENYLLKILSLTASVSAIVS